MPEMLSSRGNCAVCSKKIRMSHKNDFKDVPKDRSPPVPYVPRPSIFCRVCNVFLCIQKDHNCWGDYHSKVEYWRQINFVDTFVLHFKHLGLAASFENRKMLIFNIKIYFLLRLLIFYQTLRLYDTVLNVVFLKRNV